MGKLRVLIVAGVSPASDGIIYDLGADAPVVSFTATAVLVTAGYYYTAYLTVYGSDAGGAKGRIYSAYFPYAGSPIMSASSGHELHGVGVYSVQ